MATAKPPTLEQLLAMLRDHLQRVFCVRAGRLIILDERGEEVLRIPFPVTPAEVSP